MMVDYVSVFFFLAKPRNWTWQSLKQEQYIVMLATSICMHPVHIASLLFIAHNGQSLLLPVGFEFAVSYRVHAVHALYLFIHSTM